MLLETEYETSVLIEVNKHVNIMLTATLRRTGGAIKGKSHKKFIEHRYDKRLVFTYDLIVKNKCLYTDDVSLYFGDNAITVAYATEYNVEYFEIDYKTEMNEFLNNTFKKRLTKKLNEDLKNII